jgi:hypothetical protein
MKEMNTLETQLRSWQPRRPSAALERQLFATPVSLMPKMAWFVGWLVPATACALLTFSIFNSGNAISGQSFRREPMVATMLSNQSYLVLAPDSLRKGQNDLSSVTFDWTNRSGSTSSIPSFPRNRFN